MRYALGKPELDEEDNMKKKSNYRLVRELIWIALALVKLAREILEFLNMAFNYYTNKIICDTHGTEMVI